MRQKITEAQLNKIVKESVKNVLIQEGLGDRIKGAYNGFKNGQSYTDNMQQDSQKWNPVMNNDDLENVCLYARTTVQKLYKLERKFTEGSKFYKKVDNLAMKAQQLYDDLTNFKKLIYVERMDGCRSAP